MSTCQSKVLQFPSGKKKKKNIEGARMEQSIPEKNEQLETQVATGGVVGKK